MLSGKMPVATGSLNEPVGGQMQSGNLFEHMKNRDFGAHLWSNFKHYVGVNTTSITTVTTLRFDEVDQNMHFDTLAAATGWHEDTSNTDQASASEDLMCVVIQGSGSYRVDLGAVLESGDDATTLVTFLVNKSWSMFSNNTFYHHVGGYWFNSETNEAWTQQVIRHAATFKNFHVRLRFNGLSEISTHTFRKGGVSQSLEVAVPATTSGDIDDTSNSASYIDGDITSIKYIAPAGGSQAIGECNNCTVDSTNIRYGTYERTGTGATPRYHPLVGRLVTPMYTVDEGTSRWKVHDGGGTFHDLGVYVATFGGSAEGTMILQQAGTAKITLNLTATGFNQNTSDTYSAVDDDLLNYEFVEAVANITYVSIVIEETISGEPSGTVIHTGSRGGNPELFWFN